MNRRLLAILLLAALPWGVAAANSDDITGVASVIDGDTIEIHGTRIRLHGIDAPESSQFCLDSTNQKWRCGQRASFALADQIGRGPIICRRTDTDRYGRMIAVCFKDGKDLNAWMVAQGWAVAYRRYSHDYVRFEDEAKAVGAGIWSSQFVMPWDWRRCQRIVQDETVSSQHEGCDIKWSINSRGEKIYHMPRAPSYERPRIDKSRDQRWFCSEDEACEAGSRRTGQ